MNTEKKNDNKIRDLKTQEWFKRSDIKGNVTGLMPCDSGRLNWGKEEVLVSEPCFRKVTHT